MLETNAEHRAQAIKETEKTVAEFQRLVQVKSEKLANLYLGKMKFTQLSYLSKEEQEYQLATVRGILYGYFIKMMSSL